MAETYARPRFGEPREPTHRVNPGSRLVGLLDFVTGSHVRAVAFLTICGLLFFLSGFFNIPPIDRDEARFAQATKQMVETGDFVDIRFQDDVRYKKPVGIYWLQAAAVETASTLGLQRAQVRVWLYRVPSLIGAIGAVLLTYWSALAFVTRRGAILAGLIMCSSVLLGAEARLAKTDAMLLFTVVAAMGALARVYLSWQRGEDPVHPPWSWLAIFWRAGDAFFSDSIGGDMLSKLAAQESHGAPPGLYLLLFWVTFWPGAPLAGMAAPAVWRARREPGAQYLLAWLVPSWIVFELVLTKLPHYVLPLYPAIAILTVGALERGELSENRRLRPLTTHWPIIALLGSIGGIIALAALRKQLGLLAWPFAGASIVVGFFAWRFYGE